MSADGQTWAVRCFLSPVSDQRRRYDAISRHLEKLPLPIFAEAQYIVDGIKWGEHWYPIVKMEWVDGDPLDVFIEKHLDDANTLLGLVRGWLQLVSALRGLGVAHGDLQHGNILVTPGKELKLIDYDGMFVPQLTGESCPELGQPNYQHPQRSPKNYNENLDNFSSLVIYLSLMAVANDPTIFKKHNDGSNIILTSDDYKNPAESTLIRELKKSSDDQVKYLAGRLEEYCKIPLNDIPPLSEVLVGAPSPQIHVAAQFRSSGNLSIPTHSDVKSQQNRPPPMPRTVPPKIGMAKTRLDFRDVKPETILNEFIEISNLGEGTLTGTISSNVPWIKVPSSVGPNKKGQTQKIPISVDTTGLAFGFSGIGTLSFMTNGGNAIISVSLSIEQSRPRISQPISTIRSPKKAFRFPLVVLTITILIILGMVYLSHHTENSGRSSENSSLLNMRIKEGQKKLSEIMPPDKARSAFEMLSSQGRGAEINQIGDVYKKLNNGQDLSKEEESLLRNIRLQVDQYENDKQDKGHTGFPSEGRYSQNTPPHTMTYFENQSRFAVKNVDVVTHKILVDFEISNLTNSEYFFLCNKRNIDDSVNSTQKPFIVDSKGIKQEMTGGPMGNILRNSFPDNETGFNPERTFRFKLQPLQVVSGHIEFPMISEGARKLSFVNPGVNGWQDEIRIDNIQLIKGNPFSIDERNKSIRHTWSEYKATVGKMRITRSLICMWMSWSSPGGLATSAPIDYILDWTGRGQLIYYIEFQNAMPNETKVHVQWFRENIPIESLCNELLQYSSGNCYCRLEYPFTVGNYQARLTVDGIEVDRKHFTVLPNKP
jgi:hypothetical protein